MTKPLKITLILLAALVVLAALAVFLVSRLDTESRFEAIASEATGLKVAAKGGASIRLFPTVHVALKDVTVKNKDSQIASVGEADVGVEFWPLLRKQVRIKRLALQNVSLEVERDRNGHFNFAQPSQAKRPLPSMNLGRVSLTKATFRYSNQLSGTELNATDCTFESDSLQLAEGTSANIMKYLSLSARIVCAQMRNILFVGTDVHISVAGERGIFKIAPLTMQMMGGRGSGNIDADFTGAAPAYRVQYAVTQLQVDNLFKSLAPGKVGKGYLDFTADLSMRGFGTAEITRTARGTASLSGKDLEMSIGNLDEMLSRYESSQNFNLVDVGAFFIAGPLGTAVTKGYNFASIFQGTRGDTEIRALVSQWKVENGVAHAQDVAMATKENRLAMKGALDFVNGDFDNVTVALLDNAGCARVEQKIVGPFSNPHIEKANVLVSVTGPISSLVSKAKKLLGGKCEVFYEGSVRP